MIVCWVLFSITAAFAAVGGFSYLHYEGKVQELQVLIDERGYNVFDQFDSDNRAKLPEGYVLDEEVNRNDESGSEPEGPWIKYQVFAEHEKASNRSKAFGELTFFAGLPAFLILLWNVILHTGHWVWMGRKAR